MIEINLAPKGDKRRAKSRRSAPVRLPSVPGLGSDPWMGGLAAAGVVVLLALGFGIWRTGAAQNELETRIAQEVTDSTRFASTIALVESYEARQDTIRQRIDVIRQVDERRYVWPHLMDEISRSVPSYTWLTELTSTEPADTLAGGPSLTLQGNAGSTQALTRLMKNLEASPFIRSVTLVTSEQTIEEGRTVQQFTLEARYETPDSSAVRTVPIVTLD